MAAAAATLVSTRHGPALSPDSVTYLSAARNLVAGRGYQDFTGVANTTFAPGFPAMVAFGKLLGLSLSMSVRLVNAGSFSAIVVLSWLLLRRHTVSMVVPVCAVVLVAGSPVLLNVTAHAWSEPMFCALLLTFVLLVEDAARDSPRRELLIAWAGVVAGVAFLVRYAGLALLVTGVIVCATLPAGMRIRRRAARVAVFVAMALPLPAIWVLRNALSGAPYLLGPRVPLTANPWTVVWRYVTSLGSFWVLPTARVAWAGLAIPVAATIGLGIYVVLNRRRTRPPRLGLHSTAPLLILIAVYTAFLIVAGKFSGASVNARTVMQMYVPVVVLGAWLADEARSASIVFTGARWNRAAPRVVLTCALGCLVLVGFAFSTAAWNDGRTARGYGSATARPSSLAQAVQHLGADALVVTNHPWTLYYATGHRPIVPTPGPLYPSISILPATFEQLGDAVCSRPVYLAWFDGAPLHSFNRPNLGSEVTVRAFATRNDGALYRVLPRTPAICASASSSSNPRK